MRNTILGLVAVIVLGGAAFYLIQQNQASDSIRDIELERNFTVDKKSDIKGLIVTPKKTPPYRLDLVDGVWYLNNSIKASKHVVESILQVFTKVEMDHIPTKAASDKVRQAIKENGINVQLLGKNGKVMKTVWIGSDASFGKGTHMMMDGATQPYVMALPLITGGFRPRFTYEFDRIRDKKIISYEADDINSIQVVYPKDQSKSFKVVNNDGAYTVETATDFQEKSSQPLNVNRARAYIEGLTSISVEGWDNFNEKQDSIRGLIPFAEISIDLKEGNDRQIGLYPFNDFLDAKVHIDEWEQSKYITRYFVTLENGQFAIGQQRVLKELLRPYEHFFSE